MEKRKKEQQTEKNSH